MSFKAYLDAGKSIITLGASTNAEARQNIRDVVGSLADELNRALSLTDSYLVGAKFSLDDQELARYMADVDGKLMGSYREHHICAALYQLADKFNQLFDPTKWSVSLSSFSEIPRLVNELKNGERVVLDDLEDIAYKLRDLSSQLASGSMGRDEVLKAIESQREKIKSYQKAIKLKQRELLDKL